MRFLYFILALIISLPAQAQYKEFDQWYEVDLDEEIPPLYKLRNEYEKENSQYRWNYDFRWNMSSLFNAEFKKHITNFGTIEKHIGDADEDELLQTIKRMPKPLYQYIGPLLHTQRGLSGKILDFPGIKETKHQFPQQIASRFRDIPGIEFASPEMYVYLNPLLWGEDMASIEKPKEAPKPKVKQPRLRINPEFIHKIKMKVRAVDYTGAATASSKDLDLRHFNPDKNTPLSKADVRAFARTLNNLNQFRYNNANELKMIMVEVLMNYWDIRNGVPQDILLHRQMVNPCQSFVRKIRWANLQHEFQNIIGEQGFGIKDWAYTCDKVIKAHRVHNASADMIQAVKLQRKDFYYPEMLPFFITERETVQTRITLDSFKRMYDTTQADIEAIKPYNNKLRYQFLDIGKQIAGTPVIWP